MTDSKKNTKNIEREYILSQSAVFWKTTERWGGFSNMAKGYPVVVANQKFKSIEALYQVCRYSKHPEIQKQIIEAQTPREAKRIAYQYLSSTRGDWLQIRANIMRWCLRVKLAHWPIKFGQLLIESGKQPIVERSLRDQYWGAIVNQEGLLVGKNILGRLLMELREVALRTDYIAEVVLPPKIDDFYIMEKQIEPSRYQSMESTQQDLIDA